MPMPQLSDSIDPCSLLPDHHVQGTSDDVDQTGNVEPSENAVIGDEAARIKFISKKLANKRKKTLANTPNRRKENTNYSNVPALETVCRSPRIANVHEVISE